MKIAITGANGFIAQGLIARILQPEFRCQGRAVSGLLLTDLSLPASTHPNAQTVAGDISTDQVRQELLDFAPDVVFHLAALSSGATEQNIRQGIRVNVMAAVALFDGLAQLTPVPTVVYSSSIAVYGQDNLRAARIDDNTVLQPGISYGRHKLAVAMVLDDYLRRGLLKRCGLRLPGIVVRPETNNAALSLFSSQLFVQLYHGQPIELPVLPESQLWLMSRPQCVENLLHAAQAPLRLPAHQTTMTLPCIHTTVAALVDALAQEAQVDAQSLVQYRPREEIIAQFGTFPPLISEQAEQLGFRADDSLEALVHQSLAEYKKSNLPI